MPFPKGGTVSAATRAKLSMAGRGRTLSAESRNKISAAAKLREASKPKTSDADNFERFLSKIHVSPTGCWLWTDHLLWNGYAEFYVDGRQVRAHRYAYEYLIGPIPLGLEPDHVCRVRHCVNPLDIELVDKATNIRRGFSPPALNARKTHCPQGHPYGAPGKDGKRVCKVCARARQRANREAAA